MRTIILTITVLLSACVFSKAQEKNLSIKDTLPEGEKIYHVVDKKPVFPGGTQNLIEYLYNNYKYPVICDMRIEGRIYVRFIIDEQGNVVNPHILRGLAPILDKEALRVVKEMPKWEPAELHGKKVKVWYIVPIKIYIND